jgi:hypothetical protein
MERVLNIFYFSSLFDDYKSLNSYVFTVACHHSISLIRRRIVDQKYLEFLKRIHRLSFQPLTVSTSWSYMS